MPFIVFLVNYLHNKAQGPKPLGFFFGALTQALGLTLALGQAKAMGHGP